MDTITAPLIHELIEHIDVYAADGNGCKEWAIFSNGQEKLLVTK